MHQRGDMRRHISSTMPQRWRRHQSQKFERAKCGDSIKGGGFFRRADGPKIVIEGRAGVVAMDQAAVVVVMVY